MSSRRENTAFKTFGLVMLMGALLLCRSTAFAKLEDDWLAVNEILMADGATGEYYHFQQDGAFVDVGEQVVAYQQIGLSGNTGDSALPHLHFSVYRATLGARSQSIPINFISADSIICQPRRDQPYRAITQTNAGD